MNPSSLIGTIRVVPLDVGIVNPLQNQFTSNDTSIDLLDQIITKVIRNNTGMCHHKVPNKPLQCEKQQILDKMFDGLSAYNAGGQ